MQPKYSPDVSRKNRLFFVKVDGLLIVKIASVMGSLSTGWVQAWHEIEEKSFTALFQEEANQAGLD